MEYDVHILAEHFSGSLDSLMHDLRSAGSRSILETDRVVRDTGIENAAKSLLVEFRIVCSVCPRGKSHHGDTDFVAGSSFVNGTTAVDEIVYIVERIEVSDGGYSVLCKKIGVHLDDITGL